MTTMIDVSPFDFLKLHGGMVRLLVGIELAGPSGLSTREISRKHGWQTLINAERAGYITRKRIPKNDDKIGGGAYVINYLTPRGVKLLQDLGK